MDLDPIAEEEYQLEAHNKEQDAHAYIDIVNDDAPSAGTRTGIGSTSPLLLMEAVLVLVLVVGVVSMPQERDLKSGMALW